ncbi:MAG: hypothetical protein H0W55_15540, partial [Actinobacteria bacterium]|nr:hypothetical protein [Actinomycetota bacterium]
MAARRPTLSVSDQIVRAGDVIELRIDAPQRYGWGLLTSFEESRNGRWKAVYYSSNWGGRESRISGPFPVRKNDMFPLPEFDGDASFRIRIPDVEPGGYRISKNARP